MVKTKKGKVPAKASAPPNDEEARPRGKPGPKPGAPSNKALMGMIDQLRGAVRNEAELCRICYGSLSEILAALEPRFKGKAVEDIVASGDFDLLAAYANARNATLKMQQMIAELGDEAGELAGDGLHRPGAS